MALKMFTLLVILKLLFGKLLIVDTLTLPLNQLNKHSMVKLISARRLPAPSHVTVILSTACICKLLFLVSSLPLHLLSSDGSIILLRKAKKYTHPRSRGSMNISVKTLQLILELDLARIDESRLYPDEDFIVQAISQQSGKSIEDVHDGIRDALEDYQQHAMISLEHLGNCSHKGGIPRVAVTRYCLIDWAARKDIGGIVLDPSISLMNYRFCGEKYRSIIAWLFGDRKDFEVGLGGNEAYIEIVERCQPGYRKIVEDMFANRDGIEVMEAA